MAGRRLLQVCRRVAPCGDQPPREDVPDSNFIAFLVDRPTASHCAAPSRCKELKCPLSRPAWKFVRPDVQTDLQAWAGDEYEWWGAVATEWGPGEDYPSFALVNQLMFYTELTANDEWEFRKGISVLGREIDDWWVAFTDWLGVLSAGFLGIGRRATQRPGHWVSRVERRCQQPAAYPLWIGDVQGSAHSGDSQRRSFSQMHVPVGEKSQAASRVAIDQRRALALPQR